MDKRSKIALYIIAAVILIMMITEVTKPKPLNWRKSIETARNSRVFLLNNGLK